MKFINFFRQRGITACEQKAVKIAQKINAKDILNVGGGKNLRWPNAICLDAQGSSSGGIEFNTKPIPVSSRSFDTIICEQVIEHLHNTTYFLSEINRILPLGGSLIISTENLASIPNIAALMLQRAPFSTQHICNTFTGGWRDCQEAAPNTYPINHPAFSGVRGHVRVLTTRQLLILLKNQGFDIVEKCGFCLNHYILIHATKNHD